MKQVDNCTKEVGGDLHKLFCGPNFEKLGWDPEAPVNSSALAELTDLEDWSCDAYYLANEATERQGIRGLKSGIFDNNTFNKYHPQGDAISSNETESEYNLGGADKRGYIITDMTTYFTLLVGIFFPSCTGKQPDVN